MAGGKDGMVIAPRNPDGSLLLQKVTLPPTDHHFMPAEGRTPLTREEIARIRAWVLQGASPDAASIPDIFIAEDQEQARPPVGDYSAFIVEDGEQHPGPRGRRPRDRKRTAATISAHPSTRRSTSGIPKWAK